MAAKVRRILAFGDSLTEGYYRRGFAFHPYTIKLQQMVQNLPHLSIEIVNSGVSGEVTASMTSRLESELRGSKEPFQLGIILGGTNDLGSMVDSETLFGRIKRLHEVFLALNGDARTIALTLPETGYEKMVHSALTKRLHVNEALRRFAAESGGRTLLCDFAEKFPQESLSVEEANRLWDDGLHLTPQGYDRMGEIVFEVVEPLLS